MNAKVMLPSTGFAVLRCPVGVHSLHVLGGADDEVEISVQDAPSGHWSTAVPQTANASLVLVVTLRADLSAQHFGVRVDRITVDAGNRFNHFA